MKSLVTKNRLFVKRKQQVKEFLDSEGHPSVTLVNKDGIKKTFRVCTLVAINFIPNPTNKRNVKHIDGNILNNNASNLEWCD